MSEVCPDIGERIESMRDGESESRNKIVSLCCDLLEELERWEPAPSEQLQKASQAGYWAGREAGRGERNRELEARVHAAEQEARTLRATIETITNVPEGSDAWISISEDYKRVVRELELQRELNRELMAKT